LTTNAALGQKKKPVLTAGEEALAVASSTAKLQEATILTHKQPVPETMPSIQEV
jgi:hypothetical protein